MQKGESLDGGATVAHDHGVGVRAERCGDSVVEAVLDGDELGHRADHPHGFPGPQQHAGSVSPGEAQAEGLQPSSERSTFALALALLGSQPLDFGVGVREGPLGLLVVGVQAEFTGVEPRNLALQRCELALGRCRAVACILALRGQAGDLRLAGLKPGPRGRHPAGQSGQALTTVRLGTRVGRYPAFLA